MRAIPVTPSMDMLPLGRLGENERTQIVFDLGDWLEEYPGASISLTNKLPHSSDGYPCTLTSEGDGKYSWTITSAELTTEGDGECQLQAVTGDVVVKGKIYKTKIGKALDDSASVPDPWESWITELTELQGEAEDAAEDADEAASDAEAYAVGTRGGTDVESSDPAYHNNSKYYAEQASGSETAAAGSATTAGNKASDAEAYAVGKRGGADVESGDAAYHNNSKYYSEQAAGSATAAAASAAQAGSKANRAAIAKEYADLTYPVAKGTWCWKENVLYEANQTISTSEEWTAAHWTQTTIEEEHCALKTEINSKQDAPSATGTAGQVLGLDSNLAPVWVDQQGGGGGASIDDTAGAGVTNKAWSADKLTTKFGVIENLQTAIETGFLTGFAQGGVAQNDGVIDTTDTNSCYIGKIPMRAGDSFTFSRAVNTIQTAANLAIYNESGTFISGKSFANGTTITFDADGMFAISAKLNGNVSATMAQAIESANASFSATFDKTIKIVETVNGQGSNITNLQGEIFKMKGFRLTQSDLKTGVYYKVTNGVVSEQTESTAKYYPKIDVSAFRGMKMRVWLNTSRSGSLRSFGFCDSQNNVGNYLTESMVASVADGGRYNVIVVDKDYMFFSVSSDPTTIRIEIVGSDSFVTRSLLDDTMYNGKYYHMSFDDVITCMKDITINASTYESVFENDLFGWCKQMHDRYGTTFSMYVFYADDKDNPTWTLQNCTNAFADEFTANADWLRFGFHAYAQGVNASGREANAATDYTNTITELIRITGSAKCIDRMPRLQEYDGTLAALTAMRDCPVGAVGFLASADTDLTTPRDSYYFDSDQNAYMYKHCYMYDAENFLHFVKTSFLWGSSNESITDKENSLTYYNRNRYAEIFMHESGATSGNKNTFEGRFQQLSYTHKPCFMMDLVLTN